MERFPDGWGEAMLLKWEHTGVMVGGGQQAVGVDANSTTLSLRGEKRHCVGRVAQDPSHLTTMCWATCYLALPIQDPGHFATPLCWRTSHLQQGCICDCHWGACCAAYMCSVTMLSSLFQKVCEKSSTGLFSYCHYISLAHIRNKNYYHSFKNYHYSKLSWASSK
jgi:hypothetical protein